MSQAQSFAAMKRERDSYSREVADLRAKLAQAEQYEKHAEESEREAWKRAEAFQKAAEDLTYKISQAERERDAAMKVVIAANTNEIHWASPLGCAIGDLRMNFPHLFSKEEA